MVTEKQLAKQTEIEVQGHQFGRERYLSRVVETHKVEGKDNAQLKPEVTLMHTFLPLVADKIREKFDKPGQHPKSYQDVQKNVQVLEPERLAYLALRHLVNITDNSALTTNMIKLGKQVQADIDYAWFQKKAPGYLNKIEQKIKDKHLGYRHGYLQKAARKVKIYDKDGNIVLEGIPSQKWSASEQALVGKFLLEIINDNTQLLHLERGPESIMIRLNPEARRIIQEKHERIADLSPVILPFVIPPKPWEKTTGGCFHSTYMKIQSKLVRSYKPHIQEHLRTQDLARVMGIINNIQNVPYRINVKVLGVMEEAYRLGIGGLPAPEKEKIEIENRFPLGEISPFEGYDKDNKEFMAWQGLKARAYDKFHKEISKRTALLWKFKIAKMFKDEPAIYFCWNMDYRGRLYPLQPYINPQMDDSGKALIEFANGQPMGQDGGRWLAIHGANEFGFDKVPLHERLQWVKDHEASILDSGKNPLDGRRFWCEADNPFQFLAFCFEWVGYKEQGKAWVTHLPVWTDGTCSGLQHFSALLMDAIGGKSVNLVPGAVKADVYQEVANTVNNILIQEAKEDNEFAKAWLKRVVDRKVVKRNVMTFCYGATKRGFTDQLLSDTDPTPEGVDEYKACNYLGGKTWEAVGKVLVKAAEAMNYLQKLGHYMAKHGHDIRWTTPIGFTAVQDYVKTTSKQINTWWGGTRIQLRVNQDTTKKDTVANKNAIAPNFIHSLDAAHLMLTAEAAHAEGVVDLSFVHDSFGTHAGNMGNLNRILREQFIKMYSENLLDRWTEEIRSTLDPEYTSEFDKLVEAHRPLPGDLDINQIINSTYFFC